MVALAIAVLAAFAGGLYFITQHKPDSVQVLPNEHVVPGNNLPAKPEERWSYIKELENRQVGVSRPVDPTATTQPPKTQLTNEQRKLLEQMQADMRQQPTALSEVPYNTPRSPVISTTPTQERAPPVQPQQQVTPTQQATQPVVQPSVPPVQKTVSEPKPKPEVKPEPKPEPKPEVKSEPKPEPKAEDKSERWTLQCGSFRNTDQAESVRAQLAFAGIESNITTGGGWNRVVLGPYNARAGADKMLQRLRGAGVSGCIALGMK